MKILLTHTPHMRDNYYGARALAGLQSLGAIVLHQGSETLEGPAKLQVVAERPHVEDVQIRIEHSDLVPNGA